MLTKEDIKEILKTKGEVRGMNLKSDFNFVFEKKGQKAVEEAEKRMEELGLPLKYKEINSMEFYPLGPGTVFILVIKEVLNLDEKDIEEWGRSIVKFSLITKIFLNYYVAFNLFQKEASEVWKKYYTVGDLHLAEYDKVRKRGKLLLKNFNVHPVYCLLLKGYFSKLCEMLIKSPTVCQETKCTFKGDEYHEFSFTWKN